MFKLFLSGNVRACFWVTFIILGLSIAPATAGPLLTFEYLNDPFATNFTSLFGITSDGIVYGVYTVGIYPHYFTYKAGVFTEFNTPGDPGGVSGNGTVVGPITAGPTAGASFIQYPNATVTLVSSPGVVTTFSAVNDTGMAGGYTQAFDSGVRHAVIYVNGVLQDLGMPDDSSVTGINDLGQVVGWYTEPSTGVHGFVWQQGHYTTLDAPHPRALTAINDNGEITADGYVYINGQFQSVGFGTWQVQLSGINDAGVVVGHNGNQGIIGSPPVPEIGTAWMTLTGIVPLISVVAYRRARRRYQRRKA